MTGSTTTTTVFNCTLILFLSHKLTFGWRILVTLCVLTRNISSSSLPLSSSRQKASSLHHNRPHFYSLNDLCSVRHSILKSLKRDFCFSSISQSTKKTPSLTPPFSLSSAQQAELLHTSFFLCVGEWQERHRIKAAYHQQKH